MFGIKNSIKVFSLLVTVTLVVNFSVPPINARAVDPEVTRTVEAFTIETLEEVNEKGLYDPTGYKDVNAITTIVMYPDRIETLLETVEDFYNLDGEYINTIVGSQRYINDYNTGKAKSTEKKKILNSPTAIKATNESTNSKKAFSNSDAIDFTVSMNAPKIEDEMLIDTPGFTKKDIISLKEKVERFIDTHNITINPDAALGEKVSVKSFSCGVVQCAGAYDNFYRFDTSTGNFRIQALSAVGHKYLFVEANTIGSTKNANSLNTFKGYIDGYEENIINQMEYSKLGEGFSWWLAVSGLVTFVAGLGSGPPGWIAVVSQFSGALALFATYTDAVFATAKRLSYSRIANEKLESARYMLFTMNSRFENYNFGTVDGY